MEQVYKVVVGVFPNRVTAEKVITRARDARIPLDNVSILMPALKGEAKLIRRSSSNEEVVLKPTLGGEFESLVNISAMEISSTGPTVGAGPIVKFIEKIDGPCTIVSILMELGIPEYKAKKHGALFGDGATLMIYHARDYDELEEVKDLFSKSEARNIAISEDIGPFTQSYSDYISPPPSQW